MTFNKPQAGLSIVELLVALLISLLLMTGVVQVFMASRQTYATNEAASRLQENGRFALEFIAQSARHAGYVEAANSTVDPLPRPIAAPADDDCKTAKICSSQGTEDDPDGPDSVAFTFQPRFQDGARRDCLGKKDGIGNTDLIINHFYIIPANPAENREHPALGCASRNISTNTDISQKSPNANALIEGIDALQVQYGIGNTGNVSRYVSADRVDNWNNVLAVRIAVLANSMTPVDPPPPADRQYVLLDAPPLAFNDGKARQIFTTTVKLRNIDEVR